MTGAWSDSMGASSYVVGLLLCAQRDTDRTCVAWARSGGASGRVT
ncbi:hypothetical protein [Streptomyces sp. NPDC049813]